MSVASERLTAVLRAAQYLSNLSPEQDAWAELAQALSSFFGCEFVLVVQANQGGEPVLVRSLLSREISVADILRQTRDEIRSVLATGFWARWSCPAGVPRPCSPISGSGTAGVAIVGRVNQELFSKDELEICSRWALVRKRCFDAGDRAGNCGSPQELEQPSRRRTSELAASNAACWKNRRSGGKPKGARAGARRAGADL